MATYKYNIENGPSRDRLFDAAKYAFQDHGMMVTFTVKECQGSGRIKIFGTKKSVAAIILVIGHENCSGYSFNVQAHVDMEGDGIYFLANIYYNAQNRSGTLSVNA